MKIIKMKAWLLPIFLSISLLLSACAFGSPSFDRKAMFRDITQNVILPAHEAFVSESALLVQKVHAFQAEPTVEKLEALQAQWKQVSLAWKACELFELGPVQEVFIHNLIHKWPTNPKLIEEHLASADSIDQDLIDSIGSTSKGLPAIEYLIFWNMPEGGSDDLDNTAILSTLTDAPDGPKRMQYLVELVKNLHHESQILLNIWEGSGNNYAEDFINADSDGGELQSSISMLTNAMVAQLEEMLKMNLGDPLGHSTYGKPQPEKVEAGRSEHSLPNLIRNLETFKIAFNGGSSEEQLGFDDYLDFLDAQYENEPLSAKINAQTDAALAALKAIDGPLHVAVVEHPDQVRAAHEELKQLLVLIKADMVNHFGVTITFNDNDGD